MPIGESLLVFAVGGALVLYAMWCWRRVLIARRFPTLDAMIRKTEIVEVAEVTDGTKLIKYQPKVTFSALINGVKIIAHKSCPEKAAYKFSNKQHAVAYAANYPVGSLTQARVESAEPPALVLTSEVDRHRKSHYVLRTARTIRKKSSG